MKFLLLCAAAFLLLVDPAKTVPHEATSTESPVITVLTDSDKGESINSEKEQAQPDESTTTESPETTVPTDSDKGESIKSEEEQSQAKSVSDEPTTTGPPVTTVPIDSDKGKPKKSEKNQVGPFEKVRRKLAQVQAEVKLLDKRNAKLETQYKASLNQLVLLTEERDDLSFELNNTRNELREAQDTLKAERLQKDECKPSESEMAELIDRETSQQVKKLEREMKQSYRKQYADLLNALRRKIDNALSRQ